LILKPQKFS